MPAQDMKLTIIVPAYNVENYIGDALDSIAEQNPPFDEIIIINDGSTDSTLQTIHEHPHSAKTHVLTTQNLGLGPARNAGIEQANGDYIYFMDSDDVLDPAFTKTIHECINTHNAPDLILFSGKQFLDGHGTEQDLDDFIRGCVAHNIDGEEAITRLMPVGGIDPNAYLYISKRSLWLENSLRFKPILHEDEDILYPLILSAANASILEEALYYRRVRPDSIMSSSKTKAHSDGLLTVTLSMTGLYQTYKTDNGLVRKKLRHKTSRHACRYMRTCYKAGVPVDFRTMLKCARTLRSPNIVLGAIGAVFKASIPTRHKSP